LFYGTAAGERQNNKPQQALTAASATSSLRLKLLKKQLSAGCKT